MADISLEIHHLDVRGGDATAVIVKEHGDTDMATGQQEVKEIYRLLIDAGAEGGGSDALKFYLETFLKGPFDLIVATHYHQDHIQGFPQADIKFKQFLDNGSYRDADGTQFTPKNDIGKGSRTNVFNGYVAQTQKAMVPNTDGSPGFSRPTRVPIPFIKESAAVPGPLEIELGAGTGIKLKCYCANGVLANGTNVLADLRSTKRKPISPNDVSLAIIIEWGDFRYFTAGDLSGDETLSSYYDIEKPLVNYLVKPPPDPGPLHNKKITVFKASHHGSEFSNQSHLLTTLKPDTIIVCCNLQKQVPSPSFLERLDEYFTTNTTSKVVFTNTMKVFKNDDRYQAIQKITKSIASGNVEFGKDPEFTAEDIVSNLKIKCAVIRRRVRDGVAVPPEAPGRKSSVTYVKELGYDIVLMERAKEEEDKIIKSMRFKSYALTSTWRDKLCPKETIVTQFAEQAVAMLRWLKNDEDAKQTSGYDYLSEHYPALIRVITETSSDESPSGQLKDALVKKMTDLFDASFQKQYIVNSLDWTPKKNDLTSDEKKTIFNLLWENFHQEKWNTSIVRSGRGYRIAWNEPDGVFPEPDLTKGLKRRNSENEPQDRKKPK